VALFLSAVTAVGCQQETTISVAEQPPDVVAPKIELTRMSGRAENSKRSAIVVGDQGVVYCLDRPAWPESVVGTTVTIEGQLDTAVRFDAYSASAGVMAQTSSGTELVFRSSKLIGQ
jgi:hypothetical protein